MPRLTRGLTPDKIDNTNRSTYTAQTLTFLEKDPVIVIEFSFRFTCGYFLSATVLEP